MPTETTRRETDQERAEREAREAEQARAERIAAVAKLPDSELRAPNVTREDLLNEDKRLRGLRLPSTRGVTTTPRKTGHARIEALREGVQGAAESAIVAAARGAAKVDGPALEDVRRAHDLFLLSQAPDVFWAALHQAVDQPAAAGMSEVFADKDARAAVIAEQRRIERRRQAISDELEAREYAEQLARRPGLRVRIAAGLKGGSE